MMNIKQLLSLGGGPWSGLIVAVFTIHILFVLLTVGTPMVALLLRKDSGDQAHRELGASIMESFVPHSILAVVSGFVLLLVLQAFRPLPLLSSAGHLAPLWLSTIPAVIAAFLLLHLQEKTRHKRLMQLAALLLLLLAAGAFSAVAVLAENRSFWDGSVLSFLPSSLRLHWLVRLAHLSGAAAVAAALYHYRRTAREENDKERLIKVIFAAIAAQSVIGIGLHATAGVGDDPAPNMAIITSALLGAATLWIIYAGKRRRAFVISFLIAGIFVGMLQGRELLQERKLGSVIREYQKAADDYAGRLAAFAPQAMALYSSSRRTPHGNGATVYAGTCAMCHGAGGKGDGPEARSLAVPPQNLAALRTTRPYLYAVLEGGVPGSAMPSFASLGKGRLLQIVDHLEREYRVLSLPENVPAAVSPAEGAEAEKIYRQLCVRCHGDDGSGWELSANFRPPLPDFRRYSLSPQRALQVISEGYPGTAMPPFGHLPLKVRWGLVKVVQMKREL